MDDRELKDEELESVSGGQRVVVLEKETDGTEGPGHVVLSDIRGRFPFPTDAARSSGFIRASIQSGRMAYKYSKSRKSL